MNRSFNVSLRLFSGFLALFLICGASLEASAQDKKIKKLEIRNLEGGFLTLCPGDQHEIKQDQNKVGPVGTKYAAVSSDESVVKVKIVKNTRTRVRTIRFTAGPNAENKVQKAVVRYGASVTFLTLGITNKNELLTSKSTKIPRIDVTVLPRDHERCKEPAIQDEKQLPPNQNIIKNQGDALQKPDVIQKLNRPSEQPK